MFSSRSIWTQAVPPLEILVRLDYDNLGFDLDFQLDRIGKEGQLDLVLLQSRSRLCQIKNLDYNDLGYNL